MFQLALDLTLNPTTALIAGLSVTTVGAGVTAWLQAKKHDTAAKAVHALVAGAKKFIDDEGHGSDQAKALEDAFRAAADDWGVADHVDAHLEGGLGGK